MIISRRRISNPGWTCAIAAMCSMRSGPRVRRSHWCSIRTLNVPLLSSIRKSLRQRWRNNEPTRSNTRNWSKTTVSVAPIYSGLDGGMNTVFHARLPGKIVSLAIVLPPGAGIELPQLPSGPVDRQRWFIGEQVFRRVDRIESRLTDAHRIDRFNNAGTRRGFSANRTNGRADNNARVSRLRPTLRAEIQLPSFETQCLWPNRHRPCRRTTMEQIVRN